ncbi:hypothetical protein V2J09_006463 [Rumex salicifolius]
MLPRRPLFRSALVLYGVVSRCNGFAFSVFDNMEETHDDPEQGEHVPSSSTWWTSNLAEKFGSISLVSQEENLNQKEANVNIQEDHCSQTTSEILWSTGILSDPITDGFYSVTPDRRLKQMFHRLPTLEELSQLEAEGFRADVIVVDSQKDHKLLRLKQLITALLIGLHSNPSAIIKKISGVVSDYYKQPNLESLGRAAIEEGSQSSMVQGFRMLGKIKHGLCRPRAILFKVLADTVGLETKLMTGLPCEGTTECTDSYEHMSVAVTLNSVELLIDLMRFPGQLIPRSTKAIFMTHISAAGESDSAENDSCDSPMEPNSPMYGFSERLDHESAEKDDIVRHPRGLFTSANASGLSLQRKFLQSASSFTHLTVNQILQLHSGRGIVERSLLNNALLVQEYPSLRGRERSMLGGEKKPIRDYGDDSATPRSVGAPSEGWRLRRNKPSFTPEIGDDIVSIVQDMKRNRFRREQASTSDTSYPGSPNDSTSTDPQNNVATLQLGGRNGISSGSSIMYNYDGDGSSQRAVSLPSSPHEFRGQSSERSRLDHVTTEIASTWTNSLESRLNNDKSLLPYAEWNIDFSELTVGIRVGIGFFGEVFRGIWNGTDVAIKVSLEQNLTTELIDDFCNEISILSRLRHPNVILFLGACTKPPRLSMITEYMEIGSLYFLIHSSGLKKKLNWRRRVKLIRDICRGLMCIHRMKIVHRDLKSANCLVNKHWTVKICDFGLSRIMTETPVKDSSSAGTPEWMAPELMRNEPFTDKCDIFSLGVIIWELCTLSRPWDGVPPERVVYAVANEGSRLEIPDGPLGKLIADCWAEPNDRPSCEDILSRLLDCELTL